MEVKHFTSERPPEELYVLILSVTLYKHLLIELITDQKRLSDNIHHTHSRYNINKTARSIQKILLIVSVMSVPQGKKDAFWRRAAPHSLVKDHYAKMPLGNLQWFESFRQSHISEVFFRKTTCQQSRPCRNGQRRREARQIIATSKDFLFFLQLFPFSTPHFDSVGESVHSISYKYALLCSYMVVLDIEPTDSTGPSTINWGNITRYRL